MQGRCPRTPARDLTPALDPGGGAATPNPPLYLVQARNSPVGGDRLFRIVQICPFLPLI